MRKTARFFLIPVLSLFLVSLAQAAVGVYFGLQGGQAQEKASFGDIKFNTDTAFLYGLKAGIKILTLAAELNYYQVAHHLDPQNPADTWPARTVDYSYIGLSLRWIFPLLFIDPYITGGYGYYTADLHSIDAHRDGAFNIGAGVEIMLGRRFAVLAEGKYQRVKFGLTGGATGTLSTSHFTLSGGLNFYF